MIQLDLFEGASHLHRTCDPQTSVDAAETLPLGECQSIALRAARHLCHENGDATANEIGRIGSFWSGHNAETIRKRVHELVRRGELRCVGTRRCTMTGKNSKCFAISAGA